MLLPLVLLLLLHVLLVQSAEKVTQKPESDEVFQQRLQAHQDLFHYHPDVKVIGPTEFEPPTSVIERRLGKKVVPHLSPVSGKHRADVDAVFAYASEYTLENYLVFIESLRRGGFEGDIVLSVSELDLAKSSIRDYLFESEGVIVYSPKTVCYNFEMEEVASAKGGIRICQCHELYAQVEADGKATPLQDQRPPRTLANTRYEVYWLMLQNYDKDRWILVIDSRDTYFQSNPFEHVPRATDPSKQSGVLYFFGENAEATRLGKSKMNAKWITNAYGDKTSKALSDKPTVCSGATMGEQVALVSYVSAMVAESDETLTVLMGADQGFHNYLHYSHKLANAKAIHSVVVYDQGTGIVNNLGALRDQPLSTWGNGKLLAVGEEQGKPRRYSVHNWDGTRSPVVHQYDRHPILSKYFYKQKGREFHDAVKQRRDKA